MGYLDKNNKDLRESFYGDLNELRFKRRKQALEFEMNSKNPNKNRNGSSNSSGSIGFNFANKFLGN